MSSLTVIFVSHSWKMGEWSFTSRISISMVFSEHLQRISSFTWDSVNSCHFTKSPSQHEHLLLCFALIASFQNNGVMVYYFSIKCSSHSQQAIGKNEGFQRVCGTSGGGYRLQPDVNLAIPSNVFVIRTDVGKVCVDGWILTDVDCKGQDSLKLSAEAKQTLAYHKSFPCTKTHFRRRVRDQNAAVRKSHHVPFTAICFA